MKKMYLWMLALLMVGGMVCVSCDDDDDKKDGGDKNELVGVWASTKNPIPIEELKTKTRMTLFFEDATHEEIYMILREDGTCYSLGVFFKQVGDNMQYLTFEMEEGTYSVKNGKITTKYLDDEDDPETVPYKLKNGVLTTTDEDGNTFTFKRVDESKVKQYLEQYETDQDAKKLLTNGYWADIRNPFKDDDGNYRRIYYKYNQDGSCLFYTFNFGTQNFTCKSGTLEEGYWDITGGYYYEIFFDDDDYDDYHFTYYYYTDTKTGRVHFVEEDDDFTYEYFQTTQADIDPYLKYLTNQTPQRGSFAPRRK